MTTASAPAAVGDRIEKRVRLSEAEIRAFALSVDDRNPLHHDTSAALAAGFPALIASGTHVGSVLMAMTATRFSEPLADGTPRSSLGLGFELAFKAPVIADEEMLLWWRVTSVTRKESLRGWVTRLEGDARSEARGVLLAASGAILLRLGDERNTPR